MLILSVCLLCFGALIALTGGIWSIVVAFQRSVLWGLVVLLIPFGALVFLFVAWNEAKKPFFLGLAGTLLVLAAFLVMPMKEGGVPGAPFEFPGSRAQTPPLPTKAEEIAALQSAVAALKTREKDLLARKASLDPKDVTAAVALKAEIEAYNAELQPALQRLRLLEGPRPTDPGPEGTFTPAVP